jgi:hypothetical protein
MLYEAADEKHNATKQSKRNNGFSWCIHHRHNHFFFPVTEFRAIPFAMPCHSVMICSDFQSMSNTYYIKTWRTLWKGSTMNWLAGGH